MTQPIQSVQIYYEHPFGAEREVLKALFLYALYTMIYILLGISALFTIIKAVIEVVNQKSSIALENFNKKTFDTTYRDKYIKILSQMISSPNKFEKMDYFEFTKWTRCFIFNEPEEEN